MPIARMASSDSVIVQAIYVLHAPPYFTMKNHVLAVLRGVVLYFLQDAI